jgi:hypothetical protein
MLSAAFWLAGTALVRPRAADEASSAVHHAPVRSAEHAVSPAAPSAVMAYDASDGESANAPTLRCGVGSERSRARPTALLSPAGMDPAGANRACRHALSAHPSTAPPVRI